MSFLSNGANGEVDASFGMNKLQVSRPTLLLGEAAGLNIESIDQQELNRVIARTEIHGSAFNGEKLRVDDLLRLGMEPNYRLLVGGRAVYLAGQLYLSSSNRAAVIAYVQDEDSASGGERFTARSYYRSNSQGGTWRYLPGVAEIGGKIFWYSKGFDENSLSLPREVIEAIQYVRVRGGIADDISESDCERLLAGTTWRPYANPPERDDGYANTYCCVTRREGHRLNEGTQSNPLQFRGYTPAKLVCVTNPLERPVIENCVRVFPIESPLNSDGLPDQLILRRGKYDTEPDVIPLTAVSSGGSMFVELPNGASLRFEGAGRTWRLAEIVSPQGDVQRFSFPNFSVQEDADRVPPTVRVLSETGAAHYFTRAGRLVRAQFAGTNEVLEFVYGIMAVRCFESSSETSAVGKLEYLLHTDKFNRSMFGSVTARGSVNQLALSSNWPWSPSLTRPLYEYPQQANGDGDWQDVIDGYVCLWPHYLSQIPLIRQIHQRYIDAPLPALHEPETGSTVDWSATEDSDDFVVAEVGRPIRLFEDEDLLADAPAAPIDLREYTASEKASFTLGTVPFTAELLEHGGLRLTIRSDADSVIFQRQYLKRRQEITLGTNGTGKAIDDPTLAPEHVRLTYAERLAPGGQTAVTIYLTALTPDRETTLEAEQVPLEGRALLVRRTLKK